MMLASHMLMNDAEGQKKKREGKHIIIIRLLFSFPGVCPSKGNTLISFAKSAGVTSANLLITHFKSDSVLLKKWFILEVFYIGPLVTEITLYISVHETAMGILGSFGYL